jgi:hypothetical protein
MQVQRLVVAASVVMMMTCAAVAQPAAEVNQIPTVAKQFADAKVVPPLLQGENAANAYMAAWDSLPADARASAGNNDDERQHSTLVEQQAYVERLISAAMMEKCDWGLNYEGGLDAQLPHLGLMRHSARTLAADATRLMQLEGTAEQKATHEREAMRRIKALFRLGLHVREDRVLISSLVSAAMTKLGCSWVDERMKVGTLSVDSAQVVLGTMRSMQRDDLFGTRASVSGEGEMMLAWMKREFSGEEGPKKLAELTERLDASGTHPVDTVIAKMTTKELDAAIAQLGDFYSDNVAAWDKPDAQDQIARMATAVSGGEYGPVAMRLAAVLNQAWIADNKLRREFGETKKRLESYVLNGGTLPAEEIKGGGDQ